MPDERAELAALGDRLAALERERAELETALAARRDAVDKLERTVEDLRRGLLPRVARWLIALTLIALLAAVVGAFYLGSVIEERVRRAPFGGGRDTLVPHLLITSEPTGAAVSIDGRAAGFTPLLTPASPVERRYSVRLEAAGHRPLERELEVTRTRGAHLHARLEARTAAPR